MGMCEAPKLGNQRHYKRQRGGQCPKENIQYLAFLCTAHSIHTLQCKGPILPPAAFQSISTLILCVLFKAIGLGNLYIFLLVVSCNNQKARKRAISNWFGVLNSSISFHTPQHPYITRTTSLQLFSNPTIKSFPLTKA